MKRFGLLVLIFIALVSFASCNEKTEGEGKIVIKNVEDIAEYSVIRGDNCTDEEKNIVTTLHSELYKAFRSIKISTDFSGASSSSKEILVGNTNRKESIEASKNLRYDDYVIKKVGNKIVVAGGSPSALKGAVELFLDSFFDSDAKTVKIPTGEGYKYEGTYEIEKLTVNGINIKEYKIFNRSLLNAPKEISPKLRAAFGYDLAIESAKAPIKGEKYIIFDGSSFISDKFSISLNGDNIEIKGSDHSLRAAIDFFTSDYPHTLKNYNITKQNKYEGSTGLSGYYTKEELMSVLREAYEDPEKIIIGEEVDYSTDAHVIAECIAAFEETTGQKPGIIGIDLACYGVDLMNKNDIQWSALICDLVEFAMNGGIVTASSHWENPSGNTMGSARCRGLLGYNNTKSGYEKDFRDLITEGTEYNTALKKELDANARFLKVLGDNGVPVIWRPLHEANGNWFWFCTVQNSVTLDPSYIINLWRYVHDYYTKELGLDNLIWNYAPNVSGNVNDTPGKTMSTTYLYPGDEYCDMVGVDWYHGGNGLSIMTNDNYLLLLEKSGKIGAITEFGPSGGNKADSIAEQPELYNSMNLYGDLFELTKEGYSFAYLLTWTTNSLCSLTALGEGAEFMAQEMTLSLTEVKAMFDALK